MSKNYVEMGVYYMDKTIGLIRTVSRMFNYETNDPMIGFVKVGDCGVVSEMYFFFYFIFYVLYIQNVV